MHTTFPECCPARWTLCQLTHKRHNTKREIGIVNVNIFWISAVLGHSNMLSEPLLDHFVPFSGTITI